MPEGHVRWMEWVRWKDRRERQLASEIEFHIERRKQDLILEGLPATEAARQARLEFGGLESIKEDCRDTRRGQVIEQAWKDVRYAVRLFGKTPTFTAAAICTLALGMGACTSIFTVVDRILLRPLAYPESARLVCPLTKNAPLQVKDGPTSFPDYQDWKDSGMFDSLGIYLSSNVVLSVNRQSERVIASIATSGVLSALRVRPLAGRLFTDEESRPGPAPVALLTERTWRRRFDADPKLVGNAIRVNGVSTTVVGILPASFAFENDPEIWLSPIRTGDEAERQNRYWSAIGRLRNGTTLEETRVKLDQLCRQLAAAYPTSNRDWNADISSLKESIVGDVRSQLLVVLGAVGLVWLIVCANIATLLLVRASGRGREMAVRAALGASSARLTRQLIAESLVLVTAGGVLGLGINAAAVALLRAYGPADLPRLEQIHMDAVCILFTLGIAVFTGLLCSLGPIVQQRRDSSGTGLQEGGRGTTLSRRRTLTRSVLVVGEVALSIVLLTGSGLLIKSFFKLVDQDPGFRTDHLLTFFLSLPNSKVMENGNYQPAKAAQYLEALQTQLKSIPGVRHAGLGMHLPLGGGGWQSWSKLWVAGESSSRAGYVHGITQSITTDYFAALSIPMRRGRNFSEGDNAHTSKVAIINEEFARQRFGNRNPIGKRVGIEDQPETFEVIGVAGSIKSIGLQDPTPPQLYLPMAQRPLPVMTGVLRTTGDPLGVSRALQQRILAVDPDVPAYRLRSGEQLLGRSVASRRLLVALMSGFASLALVLALLSLYGVLAYGVSQRAKEIGIRMALGARSGQVLGEVVRQGMVLAGVGVVAGSLGAVAVTRVLKRVLFNVSPLDTQVLLLAPAALLAVALLACIIPARRAAHIDPALTLRHN